MITLTRLLAKHIASLFARALGLPRGLALDQPVSISAGPHGLLIRSSTPTCAVEYREQTAIPPAELLVPLDVFRTAGGSKTEPVTIVRADDGAIIVRWQDGAIPRATQCASPAASRVHAFPSAPDKLIENEPQTRRALREAFETTDYSSRYSLECVQLRGKDGVIAATDGSQILYQTGFQFDFEDELLVERTKVFEYVGLPADVPVQIGKTENHLVARLGAWTLYLALRKEGKFPRVDDIIPLAANAATTLDLSPVDRQFLAANLPKLPVGYGDGRVTLDLNGRVVVRSKGDADSKATELVLANSTLGGDAVCVATDRRFLERAVDLGFGRLDLYGSDSPICCRDDRRAYVWASLSKESVLAAENDAIQIESPQGDSFTPTARTKRLRHSLSPLTPIPMTTDHPSDAAPTSTEPVRRKRRTNAATPAGTIEQALSLRTKLRELVNETNELIRTIKRQKRQQRLMQTTLKSLKELQAAG